MNEHQLAVTKRARYWSLGNPRDAGVLWIAVHGYGQLAAPFLEGFQGIVTTERAVVAPEALNHFYKDGGATSPHTDTPVGASWMTRLYRESEIADYVEYLDAVATATRRPGARLGVVGFSQGVATVVRWVAFGRTAVDRVVLWAGQVPPDVDYGAVRDRFPGGIDLVHGTEDPYLAWISLETQSGKLRDAGIAVRTLSFAGGHRMDDAALLAVVNR